MKFKSDWWVSLASFGIFLAIIALGVGIYIVAQRTGGTAAVVAPVSE